MNEQEYKEFIMRENIKAQLHCTDGELDKIIVLVEKMRANGIHVNLQDLANLISKQQPNTFWENNNG